MNLRDLTLRARALLLPNRAERDLDDELQFHIERETRKLSEEGVSAEEARVQARARFGSVAVTADTCRCNSIPRSERASHHLRIRPTARTAIALASSSCPI